MIPPLFSSAVRLFLQYYDSKRKIEGDRKGEKGRLEIIKQRGGLRFPNFVVGSAESFRNTFIAPSAL